MPTGKIYKGTAPRVKTQWNRQRVTVDCSKDEPLVRQSFEPMVRTSFILDRFKRTGILPSSETPQYGDQDETTLFERQVALKNLEASFSRLPENEQAKHKDAFDWLNNTALGLLDDDQAIDQGADTPPLVPSTDDQPDLDLSEASDSE